MPLPAIALASLKYGPAAYGLIRGLLGGKSKQQKAQEAAMKRLQGIAEKGLDPSILNRAIQILNARQRGEESGIQSRLAAQGVGGGLLEEALGSSRRGLGARTGEASALFNEQSQEAQMRANEQLAGLNVPEDTTTGDLLGSLLTNLSQERIFQPKAPSSVYEDLLRSRSSRQPIIRGPIVRSPQLIQRRY